MTYRVTVVTGGSTPERDVALAGAAQVVAALRDRGHTVRVVDTTSGELSRDETMRLSTHVPATPPDPETLAELAASELGPDLVRLDALRNTDVAFLVLHGRQGEGGTLQALLEMADIPFTGSDFQGSAVAMDKDLAKHIFRTANIETPDWVMWPAADAAIGALGFPLIVKPIRVGSTVGLSVATALDEVPAAVDAARAYDDRVMLETFVGGRELTVGILEDRALAVGEIIPEHDLFDYECKYTPGMSQEIFPADIPDDLRDRIRHSALSVHRALKLRGFSRVDFRLDTAGRPFCLEVNTLPGLTRTSLFPQSAAAEGMAFPALCEEICLAALRPPGHPGTNAEDAA